MIENIKVILYIALFRGESVKIINWVDQTTLNVSMYIVHLAGILLSIFGGKLLPLFRSLLNALRLPLRISTF